MLRCNEAIFAALLCACARTGTRRQVYDGTDSLSLFAASSTLVDDRDFAALRAHMVSEIAASTMLVSEQLGRAALDPTVMEIMGKVPRHEFVPYELREYAYLNRPLPIGFEKTISQPFIVALMTDLLDIREGDSILEIGTGVGYQAAILAELAGKVYSVEIIDELAKQARKRLGAMRYTNVEIKIANGAHGWPEHAPYDKMIVTAAPELIPVSFIHQLKPGGKMVIPAGLAEAQQLIVVEKGLHGGVATTEILPVRFSQLEEESER
jgi:protein-L-isoaspartate(D-aspartate) O-methyltransferase